MQYRDVVIHTNAAIFGKEDEVRESPPIQEWIALSEQIRIGRLDLKTANTIMDTCEPKALGLMPPVRQFAHLYAFVREISANADIHRWDDDNQLTPVIGVSRLIHPTSTGFDYAARIGYESDGVKQVFPARIVGISKEVFLSPNGKRDWLTAEEANSLRELVPGLRKELPKRVHNGLWHHEYALRTYYLDHRWTLVCTGLESLVHTDRYGNTLQFKRRVPRLAAEVGVTISEPEAHEAYDLRSRLAHGVSFLASGSISGPTPTQLDLYDRLEETLRRAVLRGIREEAFADILRADDQIRTRWPIGGAS
jgi:hypothetical protein